MSVNTEKEARLSTADTALVLESQQELKALVKKIRDILDKIKTEISRITAESKKSVRKTGKEIKNIRPLGGYWSLVIFEIIGTEDPGMVQKLAAVQSTVMKDPNFSYSDKLQKMMRYLGDEHRLLLDILNKIQAEFSIEKPITEISAVIDGMRDLCDLIRTRIQQVESTFK
ncbi:hypothetical protein GF343_01245 [Candidatus Woesearchaeota archaeon]|nr:hypothetical protein [Candidatus Woesearchaeota archaeon]